MATFDKVTVTFNGTRLDQYLAEEWVQGAIDRALDRAAARTMEAAMKPPPMRTIKVDPAWFTGSLTFTLVRVRPAAPIRACLWRRNLDGGAWRKRGHVAHRG